MARTVITPSVAPGGYPTAGVVATPVASAASPTFNYFASTGKELLVATNTDSGPHTITIYSVADVFGRLGDITGESIAAGATHIFGPFTKNYWADTDGHINVDTSDPTVHVAVIRLP